MLRLYRVSSYILQEKRRILASIVGPVTLSILLLFAEVVFFIVQGCSNSSLDLLLAAYRRLAEIYSFIDILEGGFISIAGKPLLCSTLAILLTELIIWLYLIINQSAKGYTNTSLLSRRIVSYNITQPLSTFSTILQLQLL